MLDQEVKMRVMSGDNNLKATASEVQQMINND
jgi:hypothetical protein